MENSQSFLCFLSWLVPQTSTKIHANLSGGVLYNLVYKQNKATNKQTDEGENTKQPWKLKKHHFELSAESEYPVVMFRATCDCLCSAEINLHIACFPLSRKDWQRALVRQTTHTDVFQRIPASRGFSLSLQFCSFFLFEFWFVTVYLASPSREEEETEYIHYRRFL